MSPVFSKASAIDRETLIDITVNVVPMGILLFFEIVFVVYNPWGWNLEMVFWMHLLTLVPFVLLGVLTYVSARAIARDEARMEDAPDEEKPTH